MKSIKFLLAAVLLLIAVQAQTPAKTGNCNYCKLQDTIAGPLYSFGYCVLTDQCYADVWNRQNAWCPDTWIDGFNLDLQEHCNATKAAGSCHQFVASNKNANKNETFTSELQMGQYCTITVDASGFVARMIVDPDGGQPNLGIIYNGYKAGEWIVVEQGSVLDLTVYNGKKDGPISFTYIFSSSIKLTAAFGSTFLLGVVSMLS